MDRFDEMRVKNISGGGGTVIIPPEAGTLTGIAFESLPTKLDYEEGDTIDTKGMKIVAKYDNNINVDVTNGCTIIADTPLTFYTNTVKVSYQEFELSYTIKVYSKPYEIPNGTKFLLHLEGNNINEITGDSTAISSPSYAGFGKFGKNSGQKFSISNAEELPNYSDLVNGNAELTVSFWGYLPGSSKNIFLMYQSNYNNTCAEMYQSGNSLTVKSIYPNESGSNSLQATTIEIQENIKSVWVHYAITFANGYINYFCNGKRIYRKKIYGTGSTPVRMKFVNTDTADYYVDEILVSTNCLWESDFTVPTASYGAKKVLQKIYIDTPPNKTIYQSGEYFDLSGAKIMAVFSTGETIDVTSDCIIENDTPITTSDTFRKISYTYEGVTKTVYVNVGAYTVESSVDLSSAKLLMSFDGSVTDATGLNTPTIVGNDNYGAGQFGMARYFNGSTDYISMPYTSDLNIDTGDFTVAFWAKIKGTKTIGVIISNYITSYGFRIFIETNKKIGVLLSKDTSDNCVKMGSTAINLDTWYHVALVRKGSDINLYVDGNIVAHEEYNKAILSGDKLMIGAWKSTPEFFYNGYIDDLIISKSALWEGEFTPPTNPFSSIS